ncbi:MAG: hypothetical protein V1773_10635 [bacterium]
MKKIILLFIILLNFPLSAQKKGIPVISDIMNYFTTPIEDDSLKFFQTNFFNKRIGNIINGIYFEAGGGNDKMNYELINQISFLPYYSSSPALANTTLGGSLIINPFIINFGYYTGEQDLSELILNFAYPPPPPNVAQLSTIIKYQSMYGSLNYVPFSLFWGYLYPSIGPAVNYSTYKYNSVNESYVGIGVNTQVMFKFKNLFVTVSYSKYFTNSEYFNDQLFVKGGICLGMF